MAIRTWVFVVAGLIAAPFSASRADDSVVIRPKFTPGESNYIEHDQVAVIKQSGQGPSVTANRRRIYGLIQEVKATSPTKTFLTLTYDRVSLKMAAGPMDLYYDSDVPEHEDTEEQLAGAMSPMIGMPLQLELDKNLHVTSATGMVPLRKHLSEKAGENVILRQLLWPELEDARIRTVYGESQFALYPNKEVKVGEEWTRTFKDKSPQIGEAQHTYHCKLDRISEEGGRKVAIIVYDGTIASPEPVSGAEPSSEQKKIDGNFTGTATFDIERGVIVKSTSEGKTKIRSLGEDGKESKAGLKADLSVTSTWTILTAAEREKIKAESAKVAEAAQKAEAEKKAARKARAAKRAEEKAEGEKENAESDEPDDEDENGGKEE